MMKADFVARVMQIMNEVEWNDTGSDALMGSDVIKVEDHIEKSFGDAWRKAVTVLPQSCFTVADFSDSPLMGDIGNGSGYVILPGDFYRLSWFEMKGWRRGVDTLYESSDALASIQSNPYTRGNVVRPVCIRTCKSIEENNIRDIRDTLEYYSIPKGLEHKIKSALYIPLIKPLKDDPEVSDQLFTPLAYLCASLVFYVFEKPEIAAILEKKALEIGK